MEGTLPSIPFNRKYIAACYFMTPLFIKKIVGEVLPTVSPLLGYGTVLNNQQL